MSSINIKNQQLTLSTEATSVAFVDDLIEMIPGQKEALVLKTKAKEVVQGKVSGTLDILRIKDSKAMVYFFPEAVPSDCSIDISLPVDQWTFSKSFPELPETYAGLGAFSNSFLDGLRFKKAQFVLCTHQYETYEEGFNFIGMVDLAKSYPLSWLSKFRTGKTGKGPQQLEFKGQIDYDADRMELQHSFDKQIYINDRLYLKNPKITLFSAIKENDQIGTEGIRLEGELVMTGKGGQEKSLQLITDVPPHGFSFLGIEALALNAPIKYTDILNVIGLESEALSIFPKKFPEPGLESFKAYINFEQKNRVEQFQLRLGTGKWTFFNEGSSLFKIDDVYVDIEIRQPEAKGKKTIEIELGGIMELAKGKLQVYGKYPNYEFAGFLLDGSEIHIDDFIAEVGGSKPEGMENLVINALELRTSQKAADASTSTPAKKHYHFDLGIGGEWTVKDTHLKLKQLRASFDYQKTGTVVKKAFLFHGDLQINNKLEIAATYQKQGDDWSIKGQMAYNKQLQLKELDNSTSKHLPEYLGNTDQLVIDHLEVAYQKSKGQQGQLSLDGKAQFPIILEDKRMEVELDIHLEKQPTGDAGEKGYTGHLKAAINYQNILPLAINIEVLPGKTVKEKKLSLGLQENKTIYLPDLVKALISEDAAEAVPKLHISTLSFVLDKKTATDSSLEVTLKMGEPKDKTKEKKKSKTLGNGTKIKEDKKSLKLSKSKEDSSALELSYLFFHYKKVKGSQASTECQFDLEGKGKFNDDINFTHMALNYKYNFQKDEKKVEKTEEKEGKTIETLSTKWSIGGKVIADAYGKKNLELDSSFEKSRETSEGKTVTKKKLKLKSKSSKKTPLISTEHFKMYSLELIIDTKDTEKDKKEEKDKTEEKDKKEGKDKTEEKKD